MTVTENGIEDAEGKLWQLDLAAGTITDGETVLHIGVDGAEAAAAEVGEVADAASQVDGQTATTTFEEQGGEDTIGTAQDVQEEMDNANGDTATVYLNAEDYASAAINSVRDNLRSLDGDSATVTSVLIPWNSCGMTQATVLKVPTLEYLPYCLFNLISPLMSILVALIGWKIPPVNHQGETAGQGSGGAAV